MTERTVNANHWTGTEYVGIDACPQCRDQIVARAPRRPREPRRPVIVNHADRLATVVALDRMLTRNRKR